MNTVEMYAVVRRAVFVEGVSEREAARRFGLSRVTVHKMLNFAVPPGYPAQRAVCHEYSKILPRVSECVTTTLMKVGPSKPACRSRLQTASSCCGKEPWW
jgi:hypothetical protein